MNTHNDIVPATLVAIHGNVNAIVIDKTAQDAALKQAHGDYQRGIILGHNCLSGADLRGTAKSYSGRYANSRGALIKRCREAGINLREIIGDKGKRILVIG